jgi:sugar-phosphatase
MTIEAQGLLFDMDGVLVSSIAGAVRCWRRWAAEYGVADAEKVEIPHGIPARDIAQWLLPGVDVAEGLRRIEDMEIETKRLLVARLAAAGLPVPERLISADMVERGKPDPEPYRKGAAVLGCSAVDCVVFEDAPNGVRAGVAAGCRVVGVLGTTPGEELVAAGASWLVESLAGVKAELVSGAVRLELAVV